MRLLLAATFLIAVSSACSTNVSEPSQGPAAPPPAVNAPLAPAAVQPAVEVKGPAFVIEPIKVWRDEKVVVFELTSDGHLLRNGKPDGRVVDNRVEDAAGQVILAATASGAIVDAKGNEVFRYQGADRLDVVAEGQATLHIEVDAEGTVKHVSGTKVLGSTTIEPAVPKDARTALLVAMLGSAQGGKTPIPTISLKPRRKGPAAAAAAK